MTAPLPRLPIDRPGEVVKRAVSRKADGQAATASTVDTVAQADRNDRRDAAAQPSTIVGGP